MKSWLAVLIAVAVPAAWAQPLPDPTSRPHRPLRRAANAASSPPCDRSPSRRRPSCRTNPSPRASSPRFRWAVDRPRWLVEQDRPRRSVREPELGSDRAPRRRALSHRGAGFAARRGQGRPRSRPGRAHHPALKKTGPRSGPREYGRPAGGRLAGGRCCRGRDLVRLLPQERRDVEHLDARVPHAPRSSRRAGGGSRSAGRARRSSPARHARRRSRCAAPPASPAGAAPPRRPARWRRWSRAGASPIASSITLP